MEATVQPRISVIFRALGADIRLGGRDWAQELAWPAVAWNKGPKVEIAAARRSSRRRVRETGWCSIIKQVYCRWPGRGPGEIG